MEQSHQDFIPRSVKNERRKHRRIKVLLAVEVQDDPTPQTARLTELSREGARVQPARPLALGSATEIQRGGVALSARVAWSHGTDAGLHFDEPMDEQSFLRLRRG